MAVALPSGDTDGQPRVLRQGPAVGAYVQRARRPRWCAPAPRISRESTYEDVTLCHDDSPVGHPYRSHVRKAVATAIRPPLAATHRRGAREPLPARRRPDPESRVGHRREWRRDPDGAGLRPCPQQRILDHRDLGGWRGPDLQRQQPRPEFQGRRQRQRHVHGDPPVPRRQPDRHAVRHLHDHGRPRRIRFSGRHRRRVRDRRLREHCSFGPGGLLGRRSERRRVLEHDPRRRDRRLQVPRPEPERPRAGEHLQGVHRGI